jgi:hypothetical protein
MKVVPNIHANDVAMLKYHVSQLVSAVIRSPVIERNMLHVCSPHSTDTEKIGALTQAQKLIEKSKLSESVLSVTLRMLGQNGFGDMKRAARTAYGPESQEWLDICSGYRKERSFGKDRLPKAFDTMATVGFDTGTFTHYLLPAYEITERVLERFSNLMNTPKSASTDEMNSLPAFLRPQSK